MKNLVRLLFLVLSIGIMHAQTPVIPTGSAGVPASGQDAEMKQLEAEIAAFQKELETLSPEEQESFFKSMEEAVQKIDELSKTDEGKALLERLDKGDISDEELDQLINQIVGEDQEEPAVPAGAPEPALKPVEAPKPILTSKQEQIINTLNAIIAYTSAFIVKAATWPELPGKIKKWEKKKLIEWKPEITWNKLKSDIEQFISHLNLLLERDQKTKAYYHIDNLLKEETLVNNLKKIQHVIAQYEPLIEEISPLGHPSATKNSKQAFQKMINQYSEALYTLAIIDDIKKVLAKFEPTAQAARQAEEKAFQKAEAERKRKLVPGAPITVGTPEPEYIPRSAMEREPRDTMRSRYEPSFREPDQFKVPTIPTAPKPTMAPRKPAKGAKDMPTEASEDQKPKEKKEETLMDQLKKQAAKMDEKIFKEAETIVTKITENLEQVVNSLKKAPIIAQLYTHVTDASPINFELATEIIPDLVRDLSMRRGALGNIEQLHRKLPPPARKKYKAGLEKMLKKISEPIELLMSQLNKIDSEWPKLEKTITPSKLYAYFGKVAGAEEPSEKENSVALETQLQEIEKTASSVEEGLQKAVALIEEKKKPAVDEALAEAQQKIPTPISLFELRNTIIKLKEMVKNFDQPKIDSETTN